MRYYLKGKPGQKMSGLLREDKYPKQVYELKKQAFLFANLAWQSQQE